mmetsp:Transcript_11610/g.21014  ORF Transcript_11610/g.21014 Transcript_11610/m.21014 type:complete len:215 (-) Transcript_11610:2410-3054(-)
MLAYLAFTSTTSRSSASFASLKVRSWYWAAVVAVASSCSSTSTFCRCRSSSAIASLCAFICSSSARAFCRTSWRRSAVSRSCVWRFIRCSLRWMISSAFWAAFISRARISRSTNSRSRWTASRSSCTSRRSSLMITFSLPRARRICAKSAFSSSRSNFRRSSTAAASSKPLVVFSSCSCCFHSVWLSRISVSISSEGAAGSRSCPLLSKRGSVV